MDERTNKCHCSRTFSLFINNCSIVVHKIRPLEVGFNGSKGLFTTAFSSRSLADQSIIWSMVIQRIHQNTLLQLETVVNNIWNPSKIHFQSSNSMNYERTMVYDRTECSWIMALVRSFINRKLMILFVPSWSISYEQTSKSS